MDTISWKNTHGKYVSREKIVVNILRHRNFTKTSNTNTNATRFERNSFAIFVI